MHEVVRNRGLDAAVGAPVAKLPSPWRSVGGNCLDKSLKGNPSRERDGRFKALMSALFITTVELSLWVATDV